jgi:EAL domain-containing protein (putative c-di-GMP-specific phosphodiesterase class I)
MATQPLPPSSGKSRDLRNVGNSTRSNILAETEAIRALRTAHEKLLQGAIPVTLNPVVDAATKRAFAHVACAHESHACSDGPSRYTAPPSHVALRTLQMRRATAVHQIDATPDCSQLILPIETWEITECDKLLWHLEELQLSAPTDIRIAASFNANDAVDLNAAQQFCRGVKSARFGLALTEFVGGAAHIAGLVGIDPDFLFLAADLTNDLQNKPRLCRQLPAIVDACRQANISPVASSVTDQTTIDCLVSEGVRLFIDSFQTAESALDQSYARDAAFAASH